MIILVFIYYSSLKYCLKMVVAVQFPSYDVPARMHICTFIFSLEEFLCCFWVLVYGNVYIVGFTFLFSL